MIKWFLIIIAILSVIIVIAFLTREPKHDMHFYRDSASKLTDKELKKVANSICIQKALHDMTAEQVGKYQADQVCNYEEYNCDNYNEVLMFDKAVEEEWERRHLVADDTK